MVLVIPKKHIDHFTDVPDEIGMKIFLEAQRIARIIKDKLHPERVGLLVHGYGVSHAHMIVLPQKGPDDITSGKIAEIKDGRILFSMHNLPIAPRKELDRIAKLLRE